MLLSLVVFFAQLLLTQVAVSASSEGKEYVDVVMSIDEYYDAVNSNDSYTMVEFTTQWCHHCKKLKPNFLELANMYENDMTKPSIKFLEVNCEIFGTTICRDMPGFPMIYLIQPRVKPLDVPKTEATETFWQKIWNRIRNRIHNPKWQLDEDRIIDYNGKREAIAMRQFIEGVRSKQRLAVKAKHALQDDYDCGEDESCQFGRKYRQEILENLTSKQLAQERAKLESILKNTVEDTNEEAVELVKFKLEILNNYIDRDVQDVRDEL